MVRLPPSFAGTLELLVQDRGHGGDTHRGLIQSRRGLCESEPVTRLLRPLF